MSNKVERLQGTDGVRGVVALASAIDCPPIEAFTKHNILTEEFFELYCYGWVQLLLESGKMIKGDEVLIGWDSRDTDGSWTEAAVHGVSKAGGRPAILGAIPTPGLALAVFSLSNAGGIMLTASHNPADQNGIKLFLTPHGEKLLPEDDKKLTEKLYSINYEEVKKLEPEFEILDMRELGKTILDGFHADEQNSWLVDKTKFNNIQVVMDMANGATCHAAPAAFRAVGINNLTTVAWQQNGRINENSGVALLEGRHKVTRGDMAGGKLSEHEVLRAIFSEGSKLENKQLYGVVFDGDGDRFFILIYQPKLDEICILSGDESAALQGQYLMQTEPEKYRKTIFVHSVESDINLSRHMESIGFTPLITAVGDKWILEAAIHTENFGIGAEETGHSIHGGLALDSEGEKRLFFAGNGIKGAINSLVAIITLGQATALASFPAGFKSTLYSYYVNKKLLTRGKPLFNHLAEELKNFFPKLAPSGYSIKEEVMEAEPNMLLFRVSDSDGKTAGIIFIRNSGTEDKASVNLRSSKELQESFEKIGERLVISLMQKMKDDENSMAMAERDILLKLNRGEVLNLDEYKNINIPRLLTEMELKQKLITSGDVYRLTKLGEKFIAKHT